MAVQRMTQVLLLTLVALLCCINPARAQNETCGVEADNFSSCVATTGGTFLEECLQCLDETLANATTPQDVCSTFNTTFCDGLQVRCPPSCDDAFQCGSTYRAYYLCNVESYYNKTYNTSCDINCGEIKGVDGDNNRTNDNTTTDISVGSEAVQGKCDSEFTGLADCLSTNGRSSDDLTACFTCIVGSISISTDCSTFEKEYCTAVYICEGDCAADACSSSYVGAVDCAGEAVLADCQMSCTGDSGSSTASFTVGKVMTASIAILLSVSISVFIGLTTF